MANDRIKRVFVEECGGSHSVGRPRKRWIDTVKDCLKRFGCQGEWWGFMRERAWGIAREMYPCI